MTTFNPPLLLKNRHLQSIISSLKLRKPLVKKRAASLLKNSKEVIIDAGDGVRLQGFISYQNDKNRDLAILLHGWEGSSESLYLLSAGATLFKNGYNVFRLNMRDHGTSHHLNKELFNSCRLDEIVNAVKHIQQNYSEGNKSYLCGFSLGGNFALRVAAKATEAQIPLAHVIAVCPVLSPSSTMDAIEKGLFFYSKYFVRKWKKSLMIKQKLFPSDFNFTDKKIYKNLTIMTDYFVDKYTQYPDIDTYLNGYAITGNRLENLTTPAHIILSHDDPVIPFDDIKDIAKSDNLKIIDLKYGGHCGFMNNFSLKSWIDGKIIEIIQAA